MLAQDRGTDRLRRSDGSLLGKDNCHHQALTRAANSVAEERAGTEKIGPLLLQFGLFEVMSSLENHAAFSVSRPLYLARTVESYCYFEAATHRIWRQILCNVSVLLLPSPG